MKDVQNHHLCLSHCVLHALVGKELSPLWMAVSGELVQAKAWEDLPNSPGIQRDTITLKHRLQLLVK